MWDKCSKELLESLDYAEPEKPPESAPTAETKREPKRVEVEWETKRTPINVTITIDYRKALNLCAILDDEPDELEKWCDLADEIRAALSESEATNVNG